MNQIQRAVVAVYTFLVGDKWILLGTSGALLVTALIAQFAPILAGLVLIACIGVTLVLALRRELVP